MSRNGEPVLHAPASIGHLAQAEVVAPLRKEHLFDNPQAREVLQRHQREAVQNAPEAKAIFTARREVIERFIPRDMIENTALALSGGMGFRDTELSARNLQYAEAIVRTALATWYTTRNETTNHNDQRKRDLIDLVNGVPEPRGRRYMRVQETAHLNTNMNRLPNAMNLGEFVAAIAIEQQLQANPMMDRNEARVRQFRLGAEINNIPVTRENTEQARRTRRIADTLTTRPYPPETVTAVTNAENSLRRFPHLTLVTDLDTLPLQNPQVFNDLDKDRRGPIHKTKDAALESFNRTDLGRARQRLSHFLDAAAREEYVPPTYGRNRNAVRMALDAMKEQSDRKKLDARNKRYKSWSEKLHKLDAPRKPKEEPVRIMYAVQDEQIMTATVYVRVVQPGRPDAWQPVRRFSAPNFVQRNFVTAKMKPDQEEPEEIPYERNSPRAEGVEDIFISKSKKRNRYHAMVGK